MKWQLIDTAPKDGTQILCFCSLVGQMVLFFKDGYWREKASMLGLKTEPTHWMQLPKLPKELKKENE